MEAWMTAALSLPKLSLSSCMAIDICGATQQQGGQNPKTLSGTFLESMNWQAVPACFD